MSNTRRLISPGVVAAFAAIYLIWGSTYAAIRLVVTHLPPLTAGGVRFILAGVMLLVYLRLRGESLPGLRRLAGPAVSGALMLTGSHGLVGWAQQWVPSGLAAVIMATGPLWMVLLLWIAFGGKRPSGVVAISLGLGLAGVWIISAPAGARPSSPALLLAVAPLLWSSGALLSTRLPRPASTLMGTALQMLIGGAGLLVAGAAGGDLAALGQLPTKASPWLALGYLTLFGSIVALVCYQWLLRMVGPAATSTHAFVNPLVALVIGGAALGEPLPPTLALGGAMVLLAVALNLREMVRDSGHQRRRVTPPPIVACQCRPGAPHGRGVPRPYGLR